MFFMITSLASAGFTVDLNQHSHFQKFLDISVGQPPDKALVSFFNIDEVAELEQ